MRPIYENEESLANEAEVAKFLAELWGGEFHKLPRRMQMDYAFARDDVVTGFVEVKCKTSNLEDFPFYFISLSKVLEAKNLFNATGLHTKLVVRSKNGAIHSIVMSKEEFDVKIAGRKDRNDPDDMEPCAYFKSSKFVRYN